MYTVTEAGALALLVKVEPPTAVEVCVAYSECEPTPRLIVAVHEPPLTSTVAFSVEPSYTFTV
jgi:hypothetical protein